MIRLVAVLGLLPSLALAQAPLKIGYEGRLLKADGRPESGVVKMGFALFDAGSAGKELWSEEHSMAVTDGFYSAFLGEVTPLPPRVFDGGDRFLEVRVLGTALSPRQRVGSVPYALVSNDARNLVGGTVNASSIQVAGKPVVDSAGQLAAAAGGAFAAKTHEHDAADLSSGVLPLARLPRGKGSKLDADLLDGKDSTDFALSADLSSAGTINDGSNPLEWTRLKNVPASLLSSGPFVAKAPLSGSGTAGAPLTLPKASALADGYLGAADFDAFEKKIATVSVKAPILGNGTASFALSIAKASALADGYLAAEDFDTFGKKLGVVSVGAPLAGNGTPTSPVLLVKASAIADGFLAAADFDGFSKKLSALTATGPLVGGGTAASPLAIPKATGVSDGYLTAGDHDAFSKKLAAVTASAPLSGAGTLASPLSIGKAGASASGYLDASDFTVFSKKLAAVTAAAPLGGAGTVEAPLTLGKASATANGYLAAADFDAFDKKLGAITASAPLAGGGTSSSPLTLAKASATANGYLASADFDSFSKKLAALATTAPLGGDGTPTAPLALPKASATAHGYLDAADFDAFAKKLGAVTASAPLGGLGTAASPLTLGKATAATDGYLVAADFDTFSKKLSAVTATGPLTGAGTTASPLLLPKSTSTTDGYLSGADHAALKAKVSAVSAGNGINVTGTATDPIIGIKFGAVAGTAVEGNDSRLAPTWETWGTSMNSLALANVGIGTPINATPKAKLHVDVGGGNDARVLIEGDGSPHTELALRDKGNSTWTLRSEDGGNFSIGGQSSTANNPFLLNLSPMGRMGVGTYDMAGAMLTIASEFALLQLTAKASTGNQIFLRGIDKGGDVFRLTDRNGGNTYGGLDFATRRRDQAASLTLVAWNQGTAVSSEAIMGFTADRRLDVNDDASALATPPAGTKAFAFNTQGTEAVTITTAGDVGIGVPNPGAKLHVAGSVKANNILSSENFTSWLENAGDFTGPTGGTPVRLRYTNVRQNSDPGVFEMGPDGSLKILKAGSLSLTANFDVITPAASNYAEIRIAVNGTNQALSLSSASGSWVEVIGDLKWKVAAGDVITLASPPSTIAAMDNGAWSVLTAQWVGVK
jgi:hypothetical protein